MIPARRFSRAAIWSLLSVFLLLWFSNLECRKLVKPDEGRYAEIPREMATTGDWLTPRLNGIVYLEKPPLQYWATAAAFRLFGERQWVARLWSGLTGSLGVLVVFYAGGALFGAEAGLYAALVLASSFLYVIIAHLNTLDMGLSFFMTAALAAFLLAQRDEASAKQRRAFMLAAWAAIALAILSKGPIGLVLPAAVLVVYVLLHRDLALVRRLHLLPGLGRMLLIAAPWFVAVSIANPRFPRFFFIHEHLQRFLTTVHKRDEPLLFFVPFLIGGMLPWSVTLIDALARAWGAPDEGRRFRPRRFLLIYAGFIFVFFSLSQSKLPPYILPIVPALALLVGDRLTRIAPRALFWQTAPVAALAAAGALAAPQVRRYAAHAVPVELLARYQTWLFAAALSLLVTALWALFESFRGRTGRPVVALALGGLLMAQVALTGHETLSPVYSTYEVAETIRPRLRPGAPFYSIKMYDQTLPFYLGRTMTLVEFTDEMTFGLEQEPGLAVPGLEEFTARWSAGGEAYAVMTPETYELLGGRSLPMTVLERDARRVVVSRLPD